MKNSPYLCIVTLKQEIMTNEITPIDVVNVADSLKMNISIKQVRQVLEIYDGEADNDPTATWDLIVENCIYNLQS